MEKLAKTPGEALSLHTSKIKKALKSLREKLRKFSRKSQGKFKKILGKIGPSIHPPKTHQSTNNIFSHQKIVISTIAKKRKEK
jgi:hypothetical protein